MINVAGYFGINRNNAEERTYELFNQLGIWDKRNVTHKRVIWWNEEKIKDGKSINS
jgi:hypothetical protein